MDAKIPVILTHKKTNKILRFNSINKAAKAFNAHMIQIDRVLNNPVRSFRGYIITTDINLGTRQARIDREKIIKYDEENKPRRLSPKKERFFIFDKRGNFIRIIDTMRQVCDRYKMSEQLVWRYMYHRHLKDSRIIIYAKNFNPDIVKTYLITSRDFALSHYNSLQHNELKQLELNNELV